MKTSESPVRTLIFDLGNVLIGVDIQAARARFAGSHGKIRDGSLIHDPALLERFQKGWIDPVSFFREAFPFSRFHLSYEACEELWNGIFFPIQPMLDLLPALSRHYVLVMLSNTNVVHTEYVRKTYPIFDFFRVLIFSHEVGLLKPDPSIYRLALEKSGSAPEETLFIDDTEENVAGAAALGIRSFQFIEAGKLLKELYSIGIQGVPPEYRDET